MELDNLRVCHVHDPIGFAMEQPVFSWTVKDAKGRMASAALTVRRRGEIIYESGECPEADSLGWAVPLALEPRTRYDYTLTVTAEDGGRAEGYGFFETGKRDESWAGEWISPKFSQSSAVLRRRFQLQQEQAGVSARLYICGLGLYEAYINGRKVGDEFLAPGYHSYDFHLDAQTYDVTHLLFPGENELRIVLAEGWFKGRLGFEGGYTDLYGERLHAIAELYAGDALVLKTNGDWEELQSAVRVSNIYDGESFDARVLPGMVVGGVDLAAPERCGPLGDRWALPVRKLEAFPVKEIIRTPKGDTVLDFGQNLTGWVEFDTDLPAGIGMTLTAGEILQQGEFYRDNYRLAKSSFSYVSDGVPRHIRPHFTFFGFRYMKVDAIGPIRKEQFTAYHLRSDMPRACAFESGNAKVNQLWHNALWGMQDNFLEIPTDCPQRDERLGWTGDAQAISETACQTLYMPAFYRKYLYDMRCEQSILGGSVPNVVPRIKRPTIGEYGSCPWADAAVIIPWNVWMFYGDRTLLGECYPGMKAWVDSQRQRDEAVPGPRLIKDGFHFADWLALDNPQPGPFGATDPLYIASAYYYRCTEIVSEAAKVLDLPEAWEYEALASEIKAALREKYFDGNGLCIQRTQTAAALAIMFGLTGDEDAQGRVLRELVEANSSHLNTGFVGTPLLCPALSRTGSADLAVTVLLQEDCPGWLYSVNLGATTIWERWNSVLPDGSMNPEGMNSLNHYTYGSIAAWMYEYLCGLRPLEPGCRRVLIAPEPDRRLGKARVELQTAAGGFVSGWAWDGGRFRYEVAVPFGASALVCLPGRDALELGAGSYCFD